MSVFRVKLNHSGEQGQLDLDPTTGSSFTTSKQRQVYVMGPKRINRLLSDGQTFTDSNYWKRFAYPQVAQQHAFIEVVTDDGSVYSDVASENTFGVSASFDLTGNYEDSVIDFVTTHGGPATFVQIRNLDDTVSMTAELNGNTNLVLTIPAATAQVFNAGDLAITKVRLIGDGDAEVIASVNSISNS